MIMGIVVALAVGFAPRPVQEASLAQIETKLLPTNLQPITPSNIDRLEIVATFGEGILNTAGWSPDGETIAAGGARGVWLMDADDPTQNELLTAGDAGISSVAYSPDGATLAAGDYAGGITFFDTVSRRRMMTAPPPEEGYAIQQLGWLDDTRLAVITLRVSQGIQGLTYHPMLWMFDLSSSEPAWSRLEDVPLAIDASFAIGSSFAHIAYWTGSEDGGRLILLDLPTGERRTLATYTNGVQAITFSHDGGTLYAAHEFGIDRWDMATGEQLETLPNLRTYLFARYVAISPDGRYLTVADTNITIAVYDLTSGEIVYESEAGPYSAFPVMLSFSPDGSQYVCVTTNGLYFNTVAGDAPREYLTHQNGVSALALDEAGQTLAALEWGEGQPPRLWDLATGEDRQLTFERPPDDYYYSASTVDLSGDGSLLLTATGRYVTLIDTVTGEMTWQERATDAVGAAFAREDQDVFIFDQGENEIRIVGSQPRRRENSLVFQGTVLAGMASDTMFATGLARTSTEGRQVGVVVWETGTHISRNALSVGNVDVDGLAFNADGSLLAIATSDLGERPIPQTIRVMLWDWGRDHLITLEDSLYEGTGEISQLAVSGDGALVYGLSNVDGVLRVWDTESLGSVATIDSTAHGWALTSLVLSSDERMLITGGYDGLTRVWGVRG
jgi:WD40 repeat protein